MKNYKIPEHVQFIILQLLAFSSIGGNSVLLRHHHLSRLDELLSLSDDLDIPGTPRMMIDKSGRVASKCTRVFLLNYLTSTSTVCLFYLDSLAFYRNSSHYNNTIIIIFDSPIPIGYCAKPPKKILYSAPLNLLWISVPKPVLRGYKYEYLCAVSVH